MLDDALVKLMQNVWGNQSEDVDIWEIFPNGLDYQFDAGSLASLSVCGWTIIKQAQGFKDWAKISGWEVVILTQLVLWNWTYGTVL